MASGKSASSTSRRRDELSSRDGPRAHAARARASADRRATSVGVVTGQDLRSRTLLDNAPTGAADYAGKSVIRGITKRQGRRAELDARPTRARS